jgi:hypothetical protein
LLTTAAYSVRSFSQSSGFLTGLVQLGSMSGNRELTENNSNVAEVASLLALGLMRLLARKSSELSLETGENSLDFTGHRSGHPSPVEGRETDE